MKPKKTVRFKNESAGRVLNEDLGIDCAPGEVCEVEEAYAFPRLSFSGQRMKAVIEDLAPQLKPLSEEDKARFAVAPPAPKPERAKIPTVRDLVAAGVPEGVAEQLVGAMLAAKEQAKSQEG